MVNSGRLMGGRWTQVFGEGSYNVAAVAAASGATTGSSEMQGIITYIPNASLAHMPWHSMWSWFIPAVYALVAPLLLKLWRDYNELSN